MDWSPGIHKAPGVNLSTKTKRPQGMPKAAFQRVNSDTCKVVESQSHPASEDTNCVVLLICKHGVKFIEIKVRMDAPRGCKRGRGNGWGVA